MVSGSARRVGPLVLAAALVILVLALVPGGAGAGAGEVAARGAGAGQAAARGAGAGELARPVPEAASTAVAVRTQASPPDHVLVDLAPGAFYVTPARWLHGAGHSNGVQPGWFGPDRGISRAELFTLMWRIEGSPPAPPSSFPDVPRDAYFAAAVDWAVDEGLTTGVGGTGTFQPAGRVDRAQLVTMLWRANGEQAAPPAPLGDVARPSYYAAAVDWAYATGRTTGVGGTGQFRPAEPLTRGQAATFLWRDAGQPPPVEPVLPAYDSAIETVTADDLPHSWRPGCPVGPDDLRRLTVRYIDYDGSPEVGHIVLHAGVVDSANLVFRDLYEKRFPIEEVTVVDVVGGSDDAAMAWNLTTGFNCRAVTGGSGWSEHAYGRAIDLNPLQNPYISRSGQVLPPGGAAHLDRGTFEVGKITGGSPPVGAFEIMGWTWGGRWTSPRDYQHFERP